jgi:glycerol-3-phosphate O-acyltransferase / dihydroxyacetone phosphate acyltransferase
MSPDPAVLALVGLTVLVAWTVCIADILRRRDLRPARRLAWIALVVLVNPVGSLLYLVARPVPVGRTIVGRPSGAPPRSSARVPGRGARVVQQIARLAVRGLFRDVEVVRPAAVSAAGPQVWAASHLGGFSDPLVLMHALERQPRFLAAAELWRVPLLRSLLRAARAVPVERRHPGDRSNRELFRTAEEALANGDALAVFPEGIVADAPAIAPIRTGTARIVLGARRRGVAGVELVPVGIHYQDLAALRSRVYVDVGLPLDLDTWLAAQGVAATDADPGDTPLVRRLTDELEARLRYVSPEFVDLEEAAAMHAAASIALGPRAPWGRVADLADDLARRPHEVRSELAETVRTYRAELDATGLGDQDVVGPERRTKRRLVVSAVVGAVLAPFALVGLLVHLAVIASVLLTRRLEVAAGTKATIRPVVAIVVSLLTWFLAAALATRLAGWEEGLGTLLAAPLWGAAALVLSERAVLGWRAFRSRRRWRRAPRQELLEALRADRRRVVTMVRQHV